MNLQRDIILIVSQTAVGKTTAYNSLKNLVAGKGYRVAPKPVSDLFFMLEAVKEDDKHGGKGHYHPWNKPDNPYGDTAHTHGEGQDVLPFSVTSQELVDKMLFRFFRHLSNLPPGKKIWFAEWTGGQNIARGYHATANIDLSFSRISKFLEEGVFPNMWLQRVLAVIHPMATNRNRFLLNQKKLANHLEEIVSGELSPRKSHEVLDMFGHDDFDALEQVLKEAGHI